MVDGVVGRGCCERRLLGGWCGRRVLGVVGGGDGGTRPCSCPSGCGLSPRFT